MARTTTAMKDKRKPATRVQVAALRRALKDVLGAVPARGTIPIIGNVLIETGERGITLTASDLDMWAIRTLPSSDRDGPDSAAWVQSIRAFSITVPAQALAALLAGMDGDAMVTLEVLDGGRMAVSAGRAKFRLVSLPAEDFPMPRAADWSAGSFEMACDGLVDAIAAVEHAISTEETRYYLNGIYLHPSDVASGQMDLRLAATDGHRLARMAFDAPDGAMSFPAAIVGRHTVALLDKLLAGAAKTTEGADTLPARVLIEAAEGGSEQAPLLRFAMPAADGGEIEVIAKSVDGQFPDYSRVIPSDPPQRAIVPRGDLGDAIKRVTAIASDKTRVVRAEFTANLLRLSVASPELGDGSEELPIDYDGPDATIGFNGIYWRSALDALAADHIVMRFTDPAAPVLIRASIDREDSGPLVQVLMPTRV